MSCDLHKDILLKKIITNQTMFKKSLNFEYTAVPADGIVSLCARTSAGTVMTKFASCTFNSLRPSDA